MYPKRKCIDCGGPVYQTYAIRCIGCTIEYFEKMIAKLNKAQPPEGNVRPAKFINEDDTCGACGNLCYHVADCLGGDQWFYCEKCDRFRLKKKGKTF